MKKGVGEKLALKARWSFTALFILNHDLLYGVGQRGTGYFKVNFALVPFFVYITNYSVNLSLFGVYKGI